MRKIDEFTRAYVDCALWASTDENGEPLDDWATVDDLAPETFAEMIEDCAIFQEQNAEDLAAHGTPEQGGHDYWLTRNGHGTGFWDRGTGAVGKRLTDAADAEGPVDLYVGDDGKIYA